MLVVADSLSNYAYKTDDKLTEQAEKLEIHIIKLTKDLHDLQNGNK